MTDQILKSPIYIYLHGYKNLDKYIKWLIIYYFII